MLKKTILIFLLIFEVYSEPLKVDFIFLTGGQRKSEVEALLFKTKVFQSVAKNESSCVPMGDGCFDPQSGYMETESGGDFIDQDYGKASEDIKVQNTIDSDMIRCSGAYFDIFCGKAQKEKKKIIPKYEVWIDTSASLRNSDWSKDGQSCFRKSFVNRLSYGCKLAIKSFDTSIKEIKNENYLCTTKGANNTKKIIRWIKNSQAKHLYVLTDRDEAKQELLDYLSNIGATVHGIGEKPFYTDDLLSMADNLKASCQK